MPLPEEIQQKLQKGEKVDLDIKSKALDSGFNVQPEKMAPYWNPRGIGINHWYHVNVKLDPTKSKGEIERSDHTQGYSNTPSGGHYDRAWGYGGWKLDPEHNDDPLKYTKQEHDVSTAPIPATKGATCG